MGRPSAQGQPQRSTRPQQTQGARRQAPKSARPTERQRQRNEWVVPEGSPVYTAEGRVYGARRQRPASANGNNGQKRNPPPARNAQRTPSKRKKKSSFNKEKFFCGVKTFFVRLLTMLIIAGLLGFWWYRESFYSDNKSRSGSVSYYMEDAGSYEAKASVAYRNDVLYVDFTEIAQWFGMVSVGSVNSMRFICTRGVSETSSGQGGEEYAIFTGGSATVLVNGTSISLEDVCRSVDSHIWVPLSFVETYVSGIVCERDASGDEVVFTVESSSEASEDDGKTDEEEQKLDIGFKIKAQNAIAPVAYPE